MDSQMQSAYMEYMLGKSKGDIPKSPAEKSSSADSNRSGTKKKGNRPILRALQGRLEEWKDTNSQLEGVLRSIGNLRDRIYWESSALAIQQEEKEQLVWRESGFRSGFSNDNTSLLKKDIHLALDHDLLQHERMLSALRSLMASQAQTIDEIGRRLDEWMLQNLMDQNDYVLEDRMVAMHVKEQNTYELAQELYSFLASDLYWKQNMATRVFESCHDGVLGGTDDNDRSHSLLKSDPRDVIKKSSKEFSKPENKKVLDLVDKLLAIP